MASNSYCYLIVNERPLIVEVKEELIQEIFVACILFNIFLVILMSSHANVIANYASFYNVK